MVIYGKRKRNLAATTWSDEESDTSTDRSLRKPISSFEGSKESVPLSMKAERESSETETTVNFSFEIPDARRKALLSWKVRKTSTQGTRGYSGQRSFVIKDELPASEDEEELDTPRVRQVIDLRTLGRFNRRKEAVAYISESLKWQGPTLLSALEDTKKVLQDETLPQDLAQILFSRLVEVTRRHQLPQVYEALHQLVKRHKFDADIPFHGEYPKELPILINHVPRWHTLVSLIKSESASADAYFLHYLSASQPIVNSSLFLECLQLLLPRMFSNIRIMKGLVLLCSQYDVKQVHQLIHLLFGRVLQSVQQQLVDGSVCDHTVVSVGLLVEIAEVGAVPKLLEQETCRLLDQMDSASSNKYVIGYLALVLSRLGSGHTQSIVSHLDTFKQVSSSRALQHLVAAAIVRLQTHSETSLSAE